MEVSVDRPTCAFCKHPIKNIYADKTVFTTEKLWFCDYRHRNAHEAGYKYVPYWHSTYTIVLVVLVALLILSKVVMGHPSDPAHLEWFLSQTNQNGMQCCDGNDSYSIEDTEWRAVGNHYEVRILGKWRKIEAFQISKGPPNTTGKAAVWYKVVGDDVHIYCFRPSTFY